MAERRGFETTNELPLNLGIEETELIDSSDLDSFLSDADPKEVTPVNLEKEESPKASEKKESPKVKSTKQSPVEEEEEVDVDSFLDDEEVEEEEEKPKEKKSKEEEKKDPEEPVPTEDEYNPFSEFGKELYSLGVLAKGENGEEPEILTGEQLLEAIQEEKRSGAYQVLDSYLGRFGEKHKNFVLAVLEGVDPEEYFSAYSKIEAFSNLDITVEDNQKAIFREFYKGQGLKSEKIEKLLQKSIEDGDLKEDATDYHQILVNKESKSLEDIKVKKAQELGQKEQQKRDYESSIRTILTNKIKEKEFDGIPVNNDVANNAYDYLYTEKYQLPSGELLTEFDRFFLDLKRPQNHEMRVKVALLALNNFNLSVVKPSIITKETNELFANLQKKSKKSSPTTTKQTASTPTKKFQFNYPQ